MTHKQVVTAKQILALLATRHATDVFVPECKNGPSQMVRHHLRMDAWVMAKSWTKPCATCYEIKVSRSDFLADNKWMQYLPLCNELYFATAPGVCDPSELPPEAGLMVCTANAVRLITKKKAQHRTGPINPDVFRYVLMCRSKIVRNNEAVNERDNVQYWRDWLASKDAKKTLGHAVSRRIRELYREEVVRVETEQIQLRKLMEGYADVRRLMESLGLDPDSNYQASAGHVRARLREADQGHAPALLRLLKDLSVEATRYMASIERVTEEPDARKQR